MLPKVFRTSSLNSPIWELTDSRAHILSQGLFGEQSMKIHTRLFSTSTATDLIPNLQSKQVHGEEPVLPFVFSALETSDCWTCHRSFCFLINRTDMFSPLKALQLPRVINLWQLNYCTKNTPVSDGDASDCGRSAEIWICINSKWLIESSERVMRICSKIMRRINHCRFTRHLGSKCAFPVRWSYREGEIGFQPTLNWFTFLKIEVTLINKEKLNFISNNMSITVMALETRLTKYWSQQIHKFTGL